MRYGQANIPREVSDKGRPVVGLAAAASLGMFADRIT